MPWDILDTKYIYKKSGACDFFFAHDCIYVRVYALSVIHAEINVIIFKNESVHDHLGQSHTY